MTLLNHVPLAHSDSSSPNSEENYQVDDSFASFDDFDGFNVADDNFLTNGIAADPATNSKRKGRRPPSTAERRATHNAVERARRESLNGRFMELAGALPSMAQVKRPSKSIIVAKSLDFVYGAKAREQALLKQNAALRAEVDDLRAQLGMNPLPAAPPMPNNMKLDARRARGSMSSSVAEGDDVQSATSPESVSSTLASTPSIQEATSPIQIQHSVAAPMPAVTIPNISTNAVQAPAFNALNLFNAASPTSTTPQPISPAVPTPVNTAPSSFMAPQQMYPTTALNAAPNFAMLDFNSPQFNYFSALLQQQADFASINRQYTAPAPTNWPGFGMSMPEMPAAPFLYA